MKLTPQKEDGRAARGALTSAPAGLVELLLCAHLVLCGVGSSSQHLPIRAAPLSAAAPWNTGIQGPVGTGLPSGLGVSRV